MRRITFFKTLLVAIALVVGSISVSAQLLVEDFDYSIGQVITATATADPMTGWLSHSGNGTANIDVTTGLSFTGYAGSGIGGAANVDNNGQDINKTFTSQTTGTVYAAFMLQTQSPNSAGYFFMLSPSPVGSSFYSRVWVNANGNGIGISGSSAPGSYIAITPGTPVLVVVKHNFTAHVSSLFVLNTFSATEPITASQTFTETATAIGGVALRQYNAAQRLIVDGIRVGTVWSDAVAPSYTLPVATPTFSAVPAVYTTTQSVAISSTTEGASIYYTTDGTTPDNSGTGTATLYTTPLSVSATTTIKAIAYLDGMTTSNVSTGIFTFPTLVADIATLRAASTSGFYKLTGQSLLTFQDAVGKVKFIQDGTAGIVIYDGSGTITTSYSIGDKIANINCTLSLYNGMLELIPFADPGAAVSTGNTVTPTVVTLANIANYPGQLVKVNNVAITGTGNFVSAIAYPINDGTAGVLRTAYSDLPYIGSAIPSTNQEITGVVNMYSVSEADLIPRTIADFVNYTLVTPTVGTASRVTLTGFTVNWTAVANATSYDVNVYDATNALVTGSPKNITGATSATLAITGMLLPGTTYTYTVTAKGDGVSYISSVASSSSASFTTPTSGSFVMQYADVDVMTLNADLKGGAADIYELTTSGGAYTFSTTVGDNNTLVRSTTLRAAAGLAAKPIIKLTSTQGTSGTSNIFNTQAANITVTFIGLEFNGNNAGSVGQPMLFYAKTVSATNCKVYVINCIIHDFLNASGNGLIRLDGITAAAPTGVIDIQGSTLYNFSARTLYLNPANNVTNAYSVNLKNNTFYNNSVISSRANIIYSAGGSGFWSGTITIDHCTFNNLVTNGTDCIIRQLTPATGGTITISNSIFTAVGGAAPYIYISVNNSYVTGFTNAPLGTVTNSFAASPAPAYTSGTDFRLTNAGSFICADGLIAGNTYNVLAVPNVSAGGTRVTLTGFTANWTAVDNATSYDVNVYDGTNALVAGSPKNISGATTSALILYSQGGMLQPNTTYTYTVTAKGDGLTYANSAESSKSATVTTETSTGSFTLQYADVDAGTLYNDIRAGAADIYELTTSGGLYNFSSSNSDNCTMIRNTIVRAAAGLAVKPIIKLTTTNTTSGTANIFNTVLPNITLRISGIEFNGINSFAGGVQPMLVLGKNATSTNFSVYVNNCIIHDFLNGSGNGTIRLDGLTAAAPTGVIDIQGSTFYNFSGRALYFNQGTTSDVTSPSVNLQNCTFYNNLVWGTGSSARADIFYNTAASGAWIGTITINHCTFDHFVAGKANENIVRQLTPGTGGSITISNSIFTTVPSTLDTYVSTNYCYLAGFAIVPSGATKTNSFAASPAPAYTSSTDFRLTNVSSFICPDGTVAGNTYGMLAIPNVLTGATNPTSSGFTANWEAVFYASSYDVKVYDATHAQVGSTINVAGGYTSVAVTGLNSNASYTYTVTAKGGNVIYFDSPASAASAPVSTLVSGLNRTETEIATIWVNNRTIICSETGSMEVYNLQGAKVLQAQNVNKVATTLENGLYIVRFTGSNGQMNNTKIIIK